MRGPNLLSLISNDRPSLTLKKGETVQSNNAKEAMFTLLFGAAIDNDDTPNIGLVIEVAIYFPESSKATFRKPVLNSQ